MVHHGCRHDAPNAGSRSSFRAPDPPLESQDEALHLRRAKRYLHHRSRADAAARGGRLQLRSGTFGQGRHRLVHRHEEAGTGSRAQLRREVRHAVYQRALAWWHAHQLRDHFQARRQDAGIRADEAVRRVRCDAQEGGAPAQPRTREAAEEPRRYPWYAAASGCRLHPRHQEGTHRRHRGQQAQDPGHCRCRYQRRP